MNALPEFVNRWGKGALQPVACQDVTGYLFLFQADISRLRALCDRYLNLPSNHAVNYQPVSHFVLLNFEQARKLAPCSAPFNTCFAMQETEAAIWILTASMNSGDVDHVAWFQPYMFVGEWLAIMGGREVYGFPKEQAFFELPSDQAKATHFGVDVIGAGQFGPQVVMDRTHLLDVDHVAGSSPDTLPTSLSVDDFVTLFRTLLLDQGFIQSVSLAAHLGADLVQRQMRCVFLKQFYDAEDGSRACYQAIIEAPVRLLGMPQVQGLPGTYQLTLQELESHPIQAELGLPRSQTSELAITANLNYEIGNGRTIWRAS